MVVQRTKMMTFVAIALLAYSQAAYAISMDEFLINIVKVLGSFEKLITGAAYVLGILFIFRALFYLKVYGEQRSMMQSHANIKVPLALILCGMMLVYLPTAVQSLLLTTFGSSSILSYQEWEGNASYKGVSLNAIFRIIQFVGLVAFVRGVMIISNAMQQQGGRDTFGKGLIHILGGIFALNVIGTANMLSKTLGVSFA